MFQNQVKVLFDFKLIGEKSQELSTILWIAERFIKAALFIVAQLGELT